MTANKNKQGSVSQNDFFANFKLPTHLPNQVPLAVPSSLPSKPPVSLVPSRLQQQQQRMQSQSQPQQTSNPVQQQNKQQQKVGKEEEKAAIVSKPAAQQEEKVALDEKSTKELKIKEPVTIPGTTIVLENDEDIKKWIEERKKNWPSNKRIAEKEKERDTQRKKRNADEIDGGEDGEGANAKKMKRYCKFFIRGHCRNENCPNLHEHPVRALPNNKLAYHQGIAVNVPDRYAKSVNVGKSLHNLVLENDFYNHANVRILDVIERLVKNGHVKVDYEKLKKT